jgi:molecular chaperone GrpE (heat shock protein)
MEKYGQAIGGIKSQQRVLREQIKKQSETLGAMQLEFANYRDEKEQEARELKSNMFLLVCINLVFYATLLAIYCVRLCG